MSTVRKSLLFNIIPIFLYFKTYFQLAWISFRYVCNCVLDLLVEIIEADSTSSDMKMAGEKRYMIDSLGRLEAIEKGVEIEGRSSLISSRDRFTSIPTECFTAAMS